MFPLTNHLHNRILTKLLLQNGDVEAKQDKVNDPGIQELSEMLPSIFFFISENIVKTICHRELLYPQYFK